MLGYVLDELSEPSAETSPLSRENEKALMVFDRPPTLLTAMSIGLKAIKALKYYSGVQQSEWCYPWDARVWQKERVADPGI